MSPGGELTIHGGAHRGRVAQARQPLHQRPGGVGGGFAQGAHGGVAGAGDPRHRVAEDGSYRLSEVQARAILDLRLQRLTALGRDEIGDELKKLAEEIADYLDILRSRARIQAIVKTELAEVKDAFATPRKTMILDFDSNVDDEDLIQREDMVVTVSHAGYVKRVPLSTYRAQRRGGKGRTGMATRDEDFVTRLFVASTHTPVLFFSDQGQAYKEKVWRLPVAAPNAKGKALVNILQLQNEGERITTIMPLPEDEASWETLDVMFATASGNVRRNKLSDFTTVNRNGKIAMKLDPGDHIVHVEICRADQNVLLTTAKGQCIRFPVEDVRVFKGRDSTGVRGINLGQSDRVISMAILNAFEASPEERSGYLKMRRAVIGEPGEEAGEIGDTEAEEAVAEAAISLERYNEMSAGEQFVLTLAERGFGKRTSSYEYRTSGRGGKGITAMRVNARNGDLVASFPVEPSDQIMLVTNAGQLIRVPVDDIRIVGRASQGVTVFNTDKAERVVSVEHIQGEDESDGEEAV